MRNTTLQKYNRFVSLTHKWLKLHFHALLFPAEWMCTVDNCVWCHKAQIGGGFSQRPCCAFMTLCNAQCLHLFIVILHCADFMAAAATCPVMFSTFSLPHPVAWQNGGCMVCRQPACGYGGFVSTHSNLKESKILQDSKLPLFGLQRE